MRWQHVGRGPSSDAAADMGEEGGGSVHGGHAVGSEVAAPTPTPAFPPACAKLLTLVRYDAVPALRPAHAVARCGCAGRSMLQAQTGCGGGSV